MNILWPRVDAVSFYLQRVPRVLVIKSYTVNFLNSSLGDIL